MKLSPGTKPGIRGARQDIWDIWYIWVSDSGRRPLRDSQMSQMRGGGARPGTVARFPTIQPGTGHREGRGRRWRASAELARLLPRQFGVPADNFTLSPGPPTGFSAKRLIPRTCFSGRGRPARRFRRERAGRRGGPGRAWKALPCHQSRPSASHSVRAAPAARTSKRPTVLQTHFARLLSREMRASLRIHRAKMVRTASGTRSRRGDACGQGERRPPADDRDPECDRRSLDEGDGMT